MTRKSQIFHIADASIRLDSMPTTGRDLVLSVSEEDRATIAEQLEISAVDALEVNLHAVRLRGGIRVTGALNAKTVQPSVVTLEPVPQTIEEPIDRVFLPGGEKDFADEADAEIFVDLEGDDMPDHFQGNEADLTQLIVETLALALDPYPRNPGEALESAGECDKDESPFAKLMALKASREG